jgi:hypothetical protein
MLAIQKNAIVEVIEDEFDPDFRVIR